MRRLLLSVGLVIWAGLGQAAAQEAFSVSLTAADSPANSLTLRAAVSSMNATGAVTFFSGTSILGISNVLFGTAELTVVSPPPGQHTLTALYGGDLTHSRARSASLPHFSAALPIGNFAAGADITTLTGLVAVAAGDLTGTGVVDFAVANALENTVTIVANGKPAATYNVGSNPRSIVISDFNGDGHMDLAVANAGSDTVSVLLGAGDGTFGPAVSYQVGAGPVALVVADFNGDGRADLATANRYGNSISVLQGRGDGTFDPFTTVMAGQEPASMVTGDFNGDGIVDLAVASNSGVGIVLGAGDGTFQPIQSYPAGVPAAGQFATLVAADFNADGATDLAIAAGQQVMVLLGGAGAMRAGDTYNSGPVASIAWGDLAGDGNADLVWLTTAGALQSMTGNGDGTFQPGQTLGQVPGVALIAGDWNGDQLTDLAVAGEKGLRLLTGVEAGSVKPGGVKTVIAPTAATLGFRPADAPPATVTNNADSGTGSLRAAITSGVNPITFAISNTTITLTSGPLTLTNTNGLTIDGTGQNITISGNNQSRIFVINALNVTIRGLTLANGYAKGGNGANGLGGGGGAAGLGGAVFVVSGTGLTFDHITFNNNNAYGGIGGSSTEFNAGLSQGASGGGGGGGLGGDGGGPSYGAFLSFQSDSGGGGGGGGVLGGSGGSGGYLTTIDTGDMISIISDMASANSLIALDEAQSGFALGYLIVHDALSTAGVTQAKKIIADFSDALTVINLTTYPGNPGLGAGGGGGGIGLAFGEPGGFGGGGGSAYWSVLGLSQYNGTVAANTFGGAGGFGGGQGGGVSSNGAGIGGNAYGGAVFVYAGSAAFETCTFNNNSATGGANGLGSFDTSPNFGSTSGGAALYVNAGATATYPITGTPVFTGNTSVLDSNVSGPFNQLTGNNTLYVLTAGDNGFGTLRAAVQQSPAGGTILFISAMAGNTVTLKSELVLAQNITIDGGTNSVTLSGGGANRIFAVTGGAVTINNLTLKNGYARGGDGGASRFGGGGAAGMGGAMLVTGGNVSLGSVAFTGNQAQGGNGGSGSEVNSGGGGGGGMSGGGAAPDPTQANGGNGGSDSDLSGIGGVGAPIAGISSVLSAQNGAAGGTGSGGGGGASGTYVATTAQVLQGGNGGIGGFGAGGGGAGYEICPVNGFPNPVCLSSVATATGGNGGFGGGGGAGYIGGSTVFGGGGGSSPDYAVGGGGAGLGGALFLQAGTLSLGNCSFTGNSSTGGSGAQRGQGKGGGLFFEAGTIAWNGTNTFSGNSAQDGTTNPTDDGDIYGTTVNGAAAVFNITSAILQSSGGLAEVFATAPAGSTVQFDPSLSGTTISISSELQINGNLTIDGTLGGAKNIVLAASGSPAPRFFCITGGNVAIRNLTLLGGGGTPAAGSGCGGTTNGGAIYIQNGTVLISNTTFLNNGTGSTVSGGAIYVANGALTLLSSRFDGSNLSNASGPGSNLAVAAGSLTYGGANLFDVPAGFSTNTVSTGAGVTVTTSPPVTLDVITTAAAGPGSLAEAVTTAPSGSTILFDLPANSTIVTNAELFVAGDLIVDGGVNGVSISGNHDHRILFLQGGKVALKNLAFTNGFAQGGQGGSAYGAGNGGGGAGMGGAVFDNGGALTLSNVSFTNNVVQGGVGGSNLVQVNGNYSFDGTHTFDSNPDYTLGGSGGGGATLNGGGAAFSPTFGAGGLGGSLIGQNGGSGGSGGNASAGGGGAAGGFGGGGGGGGNSSTHTGSGGSGGFGGGGGSAGAGPSPVQGLPGTLGGVPADGVGGAGAGLGGGLFVRSGTISLANVSFLNNSAIDAGPPGCSNCGGSGAYFGLAKGGGLFLNSGVAATSVGAVNYGGNSGNSAQDASNTAVDNQNIYGSLAIPSNLLQSTGSVYTNVGLPYPAVTLTVTDQFGNAMPNIPITVTFPAWNGATVYGPTVVVLTTGPTGSVNLIVTANSIQGSFNGVAAVGAITLTTLFSTNGPAPIATVTAVAGTPQTAATGSTFASPLKALFKDSNGAPVPYTQVEFYCCLSPDNTTTAAKATFAGGATTVTMTTGPDGTATSPPLTADLIAGTYLAYVANPYYCCNAPAGAGFTLTNVAAPPATITAYAGSPQSAVYGVTFQTPLQALVTDANGIPVSNVTVTFESPNPNSPPGVSGTFAGGGTSATATTNPFGIATAPAFTANGSVGAYSVEAAAAGVTTNASFSLTNLASSGASIAVQSGTPQSAAIGAAFASPLQALVQDNAGHPVANAMVTFTAPAAGVAGAVFGNSTNSIGVATDSTGVATTAISANSTAGNYTVTGSTAGAVTSATFILTNNSSTAAVISIVQGTPQSMPILQQYQNNFRVKVADSGGNPVSGVTVVWTLPTSGASATFVTGGTLATFTSRSDGTADPPNFTANATMGTFNLSASVPGLTGTVFFTFTNLVGPPSRIAISAGSGQTAAQNTAFPTRFAALVTDAGNDPISGVTVYFAAPNSGPSGLFANNNTNTNVVTNSSGIATAPVFTSNSAGGSYQVQVYDTDGGGVLTYALTNLPGPPAAIAAVAGSGQSATVNGAYGAVLQAAVTDGGGIPLSGVTVTFTAPASGPTLKFAGGVSSAAAITNASGVATSPAMTAGGIAGTFGVAGTVSGVGSVATYSFTAVAGSPASVTVYAGNGQSTPISTSFGAALQVIVKDAGGNPSPAGISVVFAAPTTGATGTFSSASTATVATAATGIASAPAFTANGTLGSYGISATVSGLTPVTFTLTNGSPAVLTLVASAGTGQTAAVGSAFASVLQAVITASPASQDANVSATFTLPNSGPSATFAGGALSATVSTNSSGVATSPFMTANNIVGTFSPTVTVNAFTAGYTLTNVAFSAGTASITLPGTAGTGQVLLGINSTSAFSWTASSSQSWLTITTASGSGSGAVKFGYAANPTSSLRTAAIAAGGQTIAVTQVGGNYVLVNPVTQLISNLTNADAVAADASGNLYYPTTTLPFPVDLGNENFGYIGAVNKWTASTQQSSILWNTGLDLVHGIAVDAQNNVYVADEGAGRVTKYIAATQQTSVLSDIMTGGIYNPQGLGLDGFGNVYLSDSPDQVAEKLGFWSASPPQDGYNSSAAADITGKMYVTNTNGSIDVLNSAGVLQAPIATPNTWPVGVAVDGLGNVYYTDRQNNQMLQWNPLTGQTTTLMDGALLFNPAQLSVDSSGTNIYVPALGDPNVIQGTGIVWKYSTGYLALATASLSVSSIGAAGSVLYSVFPASTAVTAVSDSPWLTITGTSGGAIAFTTTSNTTGSPQTANITVLGQNIAVTQGINNIAKQAGDAQSANVGAAFATNLQVKVTGSAGTAMNGASVTFVAIPGVTGASATFGGSATVITNSSGLASAPALTANGISGPFTVAATASGVSAVFSLTNNPATATNITAVAGTLQTTPVNLAFAIAFQAIVKDVDGNGKSGLNVTFTAPASGAGGKFPGNAASVTVVTDSTGTATAPAFTANGSTGAYTVTASVSGVGTPASFSLTNSAAVANAITVSSGNNQSVAISSAFANPLAVLVKDILGNPISGLTVAFSAPGTGASAAFLNGNTAVTNASGIATSPVFDGNAVVGSYSVTAGTATSAASAAFALSNTVGAPSKFTLSSGTPQSAGILAGFSGLSVLVRDSGGNPVPNVSVTYTAPATGATAVFSGGAASAVFPTDVTGTATASGLTANNVLGAYVVGATIAGLPTQINFALTNKVGAAATAAIVSGNLQSAPVNTIYAAPLVVQIRDAAGNPVSGLEVFFTAPANAPGLPVVPSVAFSSNLRQNESVEETNASGVATSVVPRTTGTPGTVSVAVTAGSANSITMTLISLPGPAATITATAGTSQSATINTAFGTTLQATVLDSVGNPVPGVTVTFATPLTGAGGSFAGGNTVVTNANGIAVATTYAANGTAGSYSISASVAGVTTPATFSMTNNIGGASAITANSGAAQSVAVGSAFATLQAKVTDAGGNPIPGVTVTFSAPASGPGGSFTGGNTAVTNAAGLAAANAFAANTVAGSYAVTATAPGLVTPAQFALTNLGSPAASIVAGSGNGQSITVLTAFGALLQANVKDQYGNPVAGSTVTFTAPASGPSGAFTGGNAIVTNAVTNAAGAATAPIFTANGSLGAYLVTASTPGAVSATFSLTNMVGAPASIAATSGTPQSATVGTVFGAALQATVKDAAGNPIPNATVTFSIPAGGASAAFSGSNIATTNASGVAASPLLTANATGGSYTVAASVTGGNLAPASFSLTNLPLIPVTFTTSVAGLTYSVDGAAYTAAATFNWIAGSTHTVLTTAAQTNPAASGQYSFASWSDGGAIGHTYTVPAAAPAQPVTATFTPVAFLLQAHPSSTAAGTVNNAGGQAYPVGAQWVAAGSSFTVSAVANTGFTFTQWTFPITDSPSDVPTSMNPLALVMTGPKSILANFTPGNPVLGVTVTSKAIASGQDTWVVTVANSGQAPAIGARITAVTVTPASGIVTSLPVALGNISAGGSVQATLTFTVPSTTPFSVVITVFDGVNSKTVTFSNLRI